MRSLEIIGNPSLPHGIYYFFDLYCTDPECDCRKIIMEIVSENELVGQIHYGWESVEYYRKWMGGGDPSDTMVDDMAGLSNAFSPVTDIPSDVILDLVGGLLDETWIQKIKENYALVKAATKKPQRPSNLSRPRLKRNKKFKGAGSTRK